MSPNTCSPRAPSSLDVLLRIVPVGDAAKRKLIELMTGEDRFYHDADHLLLLWSRHSAFATQAGLAGEPISRLVACAIAFHDAIYVGGRNDNETQSADFWMAASANQPISLADRTWVAETICATADHLAYATADEASLEDRGRAWVLDLDLTPFGEEPDVFDRNTERLRAENPERTAAEFNAGLIGFFRRFEQTPRIYRTPVLATAFEARARSNLARRRGQLERGV